MAQAPFSPPPGGARDAGEHAPGEAPLAERYGELQIERYRKDDGRTLILYTQRRERPITDGAG